MRNILFAMLLMLCTIWFSAARAEEIIYCGSSFPYFHVTKDNRIFCTAYENYGDVFRSKNTLYSIDLNDMSAKKIFSVKIQTGYNTWKNMNSIVPSAENRRTR